MSNSSLVEYTRYSPNNSGPRRHEIDRITPHCVVGQVSAESLGEWFAQASTKASSNYGIDKDGRVALYVDEGSRAWTSSSSANDNRAVTIECACDAFAPYAFKDVVYERLIELCVDICRRYGKKRLTWCGSLAATEAHFQDSDEMMLTVHRWFANTDCPGEWLMSRMADLAQRVNAVLTGSNTDTARGIQASALATMQAEEVVQVVGPLCAADARKSGVLASISLAQFILESGYGKSELAQQANNCFGMKCWLSGNTWPGSAWDGVSKYTKRTQEQESNGNVVTITADFRKYACIEDSIADHSAYLLGAKSGGQLRYAGLAGCTDYKKAARTIKDGGYATSLAYVDSLCAIIEKWGLTEFDADQDQDQEPAPATATVRKKVPVNLEQVRLGDECQSVWVLRTMLRGRGYKTQAGKALARRKVFDADCDYCVRAFQTKCNIDVDGIAGPQTWGKLLGM